MRVCICKVPSFYLLCVYRTTSIDAAIQSRTAAQAWLCRTHKRMLHVSKVALYTRLSSAARALLKY